MLVGIMISISITSIATIYHRHTVYVPIMFTVLLTVLSLHGTITVLCFIYHYCTITTLYC